MHPPVCLTTLMVVRVGREARPLNLWVRPAAAADADEQLMPHRLTPGLHIDAVAFWTHQEQTGEQIIWHQRAQAWRLKVIIRENKWIRVFELWAKGTWTYFIMTGPKARCLQMRVDGPSMNRGSKTSDTAQSLRLEKSPEVSFRTSSVVMLTNVENAVVDVNIIRSLNTYNCECIDGLQEH